PGRRPPARPIRGPGPGILRARAPGLPATPAGPAGSLHRDPGRPVPAGRGAADPPGAAAKGPGRRSARGQVMSDEGTRHPLWPWLRQPLAEALAQLHSHAVLLHGPEGVGQFEFALALARAWLCEAQPAPAPGQLASFQPACGRCASCHLIEAGSHPDLMVVLPEALQARLGWQAAGEEGEGAP